MHNQRLKGNNNIIKDTWAAPSTIYIHVTVEVLTLTFTIALRSNPRASFSFFFLNLASEWNATSNYSLPWVILSIQYVYSLLWSDPSNLALRETKPKTCKWVSDKTHIILQRHLLLERGRNQKIAGSWDNDGASEDKLVINYEPITEIPTIVKTEAHQHYI